MQGSCERIIRCLCSCLISKQQIGYGQVNDERHKLKSLNDNIDQQRNSINKKNYKSSEQTNITHKISNYLTEENQINNSYKQISQTLATIHSQSSPQIQIFIKSNSEQNKYDEVIQVNHPYYYLFRDKLPLLPHIFDIPHEACSVQPDTAYPLKIHCYQQGKFNIFKYFFKFPCDVDTYQSISNDFNIQKQFDSNIDQFRKILETPSNDAKLIYLSYKKVLIMSSRDFQYVRYTFKIGDQFWNICVSDLSRQEIPGKVRGEMILTTTRVIQNGGQIQVSVSSQIDMKMAIKLEIAKNRGFAEIRKYLDKVYNHIKNNQNKSMI